MNITVTFSETGEKEDHEFSFEPRAGQSVTLVRDGISTDYIVETVSGTIHNNQCHATLARVKKA